MHPTAHRLARAGLAIAAAMAMGALIAPPVSAAPATGISLPTPVLPIDKPCQNPLWNVKLCLPDYAVKVDSTFGYDTVRDGQQVSFFYLTVSNEGLANGGQLFTTVSVDQYEIVEIEQVWGNREVTAAPVDEWKTDAIWVIDHHQGLSQGEYTVFRVWIGTWDGVDFGAHTNHHVGIEYLGTPGPSDYVITEQTHSNNADFGWL